MKERNKKKNKSENPRAVKPSGTKDLGFFEQVFAVVRLVPYGRVTSFGAVAKCLGTGKSARMVGWALSGSSGIEPSVPAHRVVNSQGLLTGKFHFETPVTMENRLRSEGVPVEDNKVTDYKTRFWDPVSELLHSGDEE